MAERLKRNECTRRDFLGSAYVPRQVAELARRSLRFSRAEKRRHARQPGEERNWIFAIGRHDYSDVLFSIGSRVERKKKGGGGWGREVKVRCSSLDAAFRPRSIACSIPRSTLLFSQDDVPPPPRHLLVHRLAPVNNSFRSLGGVNISTSSAPLFFNHPTDSSERLARAFENETKGAEDATGLFINFSFFVDLPAHQGRMEVEREGMVVSQEDEKREKNSEDEQVAEAEAEAAAFCYKLVPLRQNKINLRRVLYRAHPRASRRRVGERNGKRERLFALLLSLFSTPAKPGSIVVRFAMPVSLGVSDVVSC